MKPKFKSLDNKSLFVPKDLNDPLIEKLKKIQDKYDSHKLYMNMVVHDMKGPADAIQEGLK